MWPLACTFLVLTSSFAGTFTCSPVNNLLNQECPLSNHVDKWTCMVWGQVLRCAAKTSNTCWHVGSRNVCEIRRWKLLTQWGHRVLWWYPYSLKCIKLSKGVIPKLNVSWVKFLILFVVMEWQTIPKIILMGFSFIFVSAVRARRIKTKKRTWHLLKTTAYLIRVSIKVAH